MSCKGKQKEKMRTRSERKTDGRASFTSLKNRLVKKRRPNMRTVMARTKKSGEETG